MGVGDTLERKGELEFPDALQNALSATLLPGPT